MQYVQKSIIEHKFKEVLSTRG